MMIKQKLAIYLTMTLLLVGCFKEESYNTLMVLRPEEQLISGGDFTSLEGCVAYAFAVSSDEYAFESYDDALNGIVTNIESGEEAAIYAIATPYDNDFVGALSMQIAIENVMMVVVDTKNEAYAYADYTLGMNLDITYISIPFRPWKDDDFVQGDWTYIIPETVVVDELDE